MLVRFSTFLLGPLLLLQGKKVRRDTPMLPEPKGDREGSAGVGRPLKLLVVGDSAAAGVGAEHQSDALMGNMVALLQKSHQLHWKLFAKTGATTKITLRSLQKLQEEHYDVVITSLGVNDVTSMVDPQVWLEQQQALRQLIMKKFSPGMIISCGLPPMSSFPALPQPLRWYLGLKAVRLSRALEVALEDEPKARYLPINFSTDQGLMASDGFHPGPEAYALWAAQLVKSIEHGNSYESTE